MENDEAFEADAEFVSGDRLVITRESHSDKRSERIGIRGSSPDKHIIESSSERDALLPHRQESISTWPGEHDYAGLTWWTRPSIYWLVFPFFLYTLAFGGIIVPKLELILSLVCRDHLADQAGATPIDLFGNDSQCNTPEVSALATKFTLVLSLVSGFLSALVSPKMGALSDRYGRKRLLAITTSGGILSEIVTIFAATYPDTVNYRILILGAFFEGICGSFIAGMAITHSYAADCTPPTKRAVAFGYFHACLFGGIAFGPLLAGVVIKATGQILVIFYIALIAHCIFLSFLVFAIPESLPKKRQMAAREKYRTEREEDAKNGKTTSIFHAANILAPLKILYPTGAGSSPRLRANLVLLSAVDTILFGTAMGAMTVTIYYSKLAFTWDAFRTNMFVATLNSCRVTALVVILPTLNYLFRTRVRARARRLSGIEIAEKQSGSDNLDLNIIRFSVFLDTLGYIGYATVRTGALFTASGVLASIGGMGSPTLQSALTKHVPQDRVGQLLGATGLLHALARIVSPTVFSLLYASTVKTMPQAVFVVLACCFAMAFVVSWFVKPHVYLEDHADGADTTPHGV